ncbi:MAG TPA: Xaa-Pro peptidase family protein [Aggregatilineaceae bacterium]|jgi:Xaa-Pro dipeptidase|nr:Xaa-Pro peptidase family protein [Aggregatilineaceae bacterium]
MSHPRVEKVVNIAARSNLDAVALIPGANLYYVTGLDFHLMERPLVVFFVPGRDPVAVVPALEEARLAACGIPMELFAWNDADGYQAAFAAAAGELKLIGKRLGVEELRMRVLEAQLIEGYFLGLKLVPAGDALADLRLRKSPEELAALREAIAVSEGALRAVLDQIRPGMTEREIAGLLVIEQLKRGGGKHPFEPVVASGPNAALPHSEPGERRIAEHGPLLFDFGTTVRGYASDITRTFSIGEPSQRLAEVYAVVKAANAAGRAVAGPGVPAQDVDRAAREMIEDAGYGPYFRHRTGHGLGLEAHEGPNIVEGNTQVLEPGMVFTIEPGIYLLGELGVRIEDDMVITPDGAESLTTFPRDLLPIG